MTDRPTPSRPLKPRAPDEGARWRLFVAAPLPDVAATQLWEALANVRTAHPLVRWLAPDKLHLTLVFIGSTDPRSVEQLSAAIADVATRHAAFEVATGDAGGRIGGRRGGVAWLRLARGGHEVAQLALAVDGAIGTHIYDEHNAPRPHLTVARGVTVEALAVLRESAARVAIGWTVERIALFRSDTGRAGSRYVQLTSASLRLRE